jgi:hypothetical protein
MKREPEHVKRAREAAHKHKAAASDKPRGQHNPGADDPPPNPFAGVSDDDLDDAPPPDADVPPPQEAEGEEKGKGPNMATKIVAQAQTAGVKVFRTPDHVPYAKIPVAKHQEVYSIQSTVFRRWLGKLYYQATKRAANANAIADAVAILAAVAVHDSEEIEVYTRVARNDNSIFIDLADAKWRAIEIARDGWRIVTKPPVMFRRPAGMYPLPEPKRGGSIDLLRPFVNTKSEAGFRLVVAFLVASMRPGRPFPVLFLRGEQGSAKSTLARLLRRLIDSNKAPLRRPPRDDRDLIIAATNGWMVVFDNLSFVPDWLSDALCCLATGAGLGTRTLFTDSDETLFQAMRPMILTAIEDVVTRGDLMDRGLPVELDPIPDEERRTEAELEAEFAKVEPLILGALLDAVSAALRNLSSVKLPTLPRMADFALWVSAAEPALGWKPGSFTADYAGNREQSTEAILADSPLYEPLLRLLGSHGDTWRGTPRELLDALTANVGDTIAKSQSWPKRPNALTNRLKRLYPALRHVGITVERGREGHDRRRILTVAKRVCKTSSAPSASSAASDSCDGAADGPADDADESGETSSAGNPRDFWAATDADDADDPLRPSHENDAGPYRDRI